MKLKKTIPTDKSDSVYYVDKDRDLIATKPLLVVYQMTPDKRGFRRAQYVHSQKEWLDWESFVIEIDDVIGWVDVDFLLND